MALFIIQKGVNGKFPIGLRLASPDLESSETITAVAASVSPVGLTLGTPGIDGDEVFVEVSVGTAGTDYEVQFKITTSSGKVFEHPELNAILVKVVS